jgi:poly(A) polymerase
MKGVEQPPQFHPEGDVWVHTLMLLEGLRAPTATLAWGALLHDVGKPVTFTPPARPGDRIRFNGHEEVGARIAEQICARLRFAARDTERVVELVENHLKFINLAQMRASTMKRFLRMEGFEEHLELHRLDCLASHGDLTTHRLAREQLTRLGAEELRPKPLLNGRDLIALGYTPGPEFRKMLEDAETAQLEGAIHTPEGARQWILARYRR